MKKLLFLALLLCASLSSSAQLFGHKNSLPLVTHDDSVVFIRQLFKTERHSGRLGTAMAGIALGNIVYSLSTDKKLQHSSWGKALAVGSGAGMMYISVLDITKWSRFSKRREAETIRRFELHQPQPLYVQQRLLLAYARARR